MLSIFTLLCNRSLETFSSCKTDSVPTEHWVFPPHPGLDNHLSSFCLYDFNYFRYFLWVESYSICLFVTGSFHFAKCPWGSSRWSTWQGFLLFHSCTIFHYMYIPHFLYPFFRQWTLGCFYLLAICVKLQEHECVHLSCRFCSCLLYTSDAADEDSPV